MLRVDTKLRCVVIFMLSHRVRSTDTQTITIEKTIPMHGVICVPNVNVPSGEDVVETYDIEHGKYGWCTHYACYYQD